MNSIFKNIVCVFILFACAVSNANALNIENASHIFDLERTASHSLNLPSDLVVNDDGKIYVVDSGNHRIAIYQSDGSFENTIGSKGSDKLQFLFPTGIGIDTKGNIYVADSGNNRIQILDHQGLFIRQIAVTENNIELRPVDVAVSLDNQKIYVSSSTNHKIMTFDPNGVLQDVWGGKGSHTSEFHYPATLVVAKNDDVYIVDVLNSRIQVLNSNGVFQSTVGSWGVLPGQLFRPKGVALGENGEVYITDSYLDVLEIYDSKLKYQSLLGSKGAPVKFHAPVGLTIDSDNRIYICEMLSHKVSVFQLEQSTNAH